MLHFVDHESRQALGNSLESVGFNRMFLINPNR